MNERIIEYFKSNYGYDINVNIMYKCMCDCITSNGNYKYKYVCLNFERMLFVSNIISTYDIAVFGRMDLERIIRIQDILK